MEDDGPALRALAERLAVTTEYWDFSGQRRRVSPTTLRAVLASLDIDASSSAAIAAADAKLTAEPWRHLLPPVVVMRQGEWTHIAVHGEAGVKAEVWIELECDPAAGRLGGRWETYEVAGASQGLMVDSRMVERRTFAIPGELPCGYHTLRARCGTREADCDLVVAPARLELPDWLAERTASGLMAQLYSVRSSTSWGVGDYADLADLAYLGAMRAGADFVLINPVHAAEPNPPITPSPYLPSSRLFYNVQSIRPQAIREFAYADAATAAIVRRAAAQAATANEGEGLIDRERSWRLKLRALEAIYALPRSAARTEDLARFSRAGGEQLRAYAQWCVLREAVGSPRRGRPAAAWEQVPPRDSRHAREILTRPESARREEFHIWLQWVADQQLAIAQRTARRAGMRIGIMHDLAVGVHPAGADAWALGDLVARRMSAGAPGDNFNPLGQDWSQPPWRPDALARTGYQAYRRMLRAAFAHAGAVRVDHIIGLFRLWWIPQGMPAAEGAYVRYDHEAMIGILLLEAQRAGAIVIGEDLGLVEPWVRQYLAERGVLGTSVVWFEHEDDGGFPRQPEHYRRLCLATLTTHDLTPTAGFLAEEHIDVREGLGLLTEPAAEAHRHATEQREAMLRLLRERALLPQFPDERETIRALHRFLRATPAVLRGISLCDLVGERRAQNQPGIEDGYPSWRVPLGDGEGRPILLDHLFDSTVV